MKCLMIMVIGLALRRQFKLFSCVILVLLLKSASDWVYMILIETVELVLFIFLMV